jgi:hypothetical protein
MVCDTFDVGCQDAETKRDVDSTSIDHSVYR